MPDGTQSRRSGPVDQDLTAAPRRPRYRLPADIASPPRRSRVRLRDDIATDPSPLALIRDRRTYVDTLEVNFRRPLSARFRDALLRAQDGDRARCLYRTPSERHDLRKVTLHRPTLDAIRLIEERPQWHAVARYHQAFDLITETEVDARTVAAYLSRCLVQKWAGHRRVANVETTTYGASNPLTARNFAIYATRPSKPSGAPCCHVEIRYETPKACKDRVGLERVRDVTGIDPVDLFARNFRLVELRDPAAFDAAAEARLDTLARRRHREALARRDLTAYASIPSWAFSRTVADHRAFLKAFIAHRAFVYLRHDLLSRWAALPIGFLRDVFPTLLPFFTVERPISGAFF